MPGLRKAEISRRLCAALSESGCEPRIVFDSSPGGRILPIRLEVRFPNTVERRYYLYCWTLGHGGRTRRSTEYRIQAKLEGHRSLVFAGATTILVGYYDWAIDRVGPQVGTCPPRGMRVIAAWNAVDHASVGASSSCQVSFNTLYHAYIAGTADAQRRLLSRDTERVIAFRSEYLARYLYLLPEGHANITAVSLANSIL